jgi:DNA segregation ATPase FtsK/SpoIIIE-like protein
MGHTLVTGASGSGKSNWLHAALAALLSGASPEVLRLAVVDPKVSEFAAWGRVPHLWAPIASDEAGAVRLLGAVVSELDRRGELLAGALVRDLAGYNRGAAVKLPVLLVCFDEVLDLVLAAGGERSELARLLTRLAVKGRSAGVFLWVASQHARFDLLPRAVTVNMHSRLVFRVGDQAAANMAGCPGAERIGRDVPGRFLAALDGGAPAGFQAFNLADGELLAVVSGIVGADVGPAPMVLSDVERALVRHAVMDLDGGFVVGKLAAVFRDRGITHHQVRGIAERWERDGLLTAPASITAPRMVTGALATLAGVDLRHVVGAE